MQPFYFQAKDGLICELTPYWCHKLSRYLQTAEITGGEKFPYGNFFLLFNIVFFSFIFISWRLIILQYS